MKSIPPRDTVSASLRGRLAALLTLLLTLNVFAQSGTLKVPDAAQFVGQPQGTPIAGAPLELRTNEVGGLLRCPVCQGMSISDSPAEMAVNMKGQVRELLERGYTEEQILKYFELSYGQFVLLKPKFEGVTTMVWLLPAAALLLGAVIVFFTFRRLTAAPKASDSAPAAAAPVEDPYLARVRDLVSGGKS
ncbi:MAG TPA: cytochrome c-type biogenesis protein CcmH [Thermoanaerobaculia bacterium]|nr:cytochrome c-type biogenesis protein CcmH [Thermoanaerobaculia bacterium]